MPASSGHQFNFGPAGARPRDPEAPMRLLLVGDFSGCPAAERTPLGQRRCLRVDLDNLDQVFTRLQPQVETVAGTLKAQSPDDFHPDALFRNLPLFETLREARARPAPSTASANSDDKGSSSNTSSPLAALLGGDPTGGTMAPSSSPSSAAAGGKGGLDALLHRIVSPHIVPDTASQTEAYLRAVDAAIAEQMRQVLHAPAFQALEANWRGLQWLLSRLELSEQLQVHLLDVTRDELLADLGGTETPVTLEQTASYQVLVNPARRQAGEAGWSAIVGLFQFGLQDADIQALAALGAIASHAGGPLLAGADVAAWQSQEDAADDTDSPWHSLRTNTVASWIGLAGPRLLMRLPYGSRQDKVEGFAFEELHGSPEHEHYLWAPAALAPALLIGHGYGINEGWDFSPGDQREIDDLPSCTRMDRDGEPELVPCAEYFLTDRQADRLLDAGLMPLLSHRHRNVAALMRFQSVAQPFASLSGLPS